MGFEGGGGFRVDGSLSVCVCVRAGEMEGRGNSRESRGEAQGGLEEGGMGGVDQPKRRITRLRLTVVLLYAILAPNTVYVSLCNTLQCIWRKLYNSKW